jgi:hypothetical protein
LSIDVTEAGSPFNAFDIYLGFDPAALTPVPLSPLSLQEGSYFSAACPNRFHRFKAGTDRDTISDVLLCAATSLTGPGQIYRVRFQASSTPQVTTVKFLPGLQFYNEGVFVNPAYSGSAIVWIGTPLAVPAAPSVRDLSLSAAPNPARGAMGFELGLPEAGTASLEVADIQGRVVRKIEAGVLEAGTHVLAWDGRDAAGLTVAPGIYLARARLGSWTVHTRFVRTR